MSTPNNYFLQAILPNIPSQLYKPVLESSTLQMISTEAIKVNEDLVKSKENTKQKKFDINAQGSILAILESEEESEISDQSFQLLEKIFNSMQIKSTDINYLKQWGKDLNQDMLCSQLLPTKTRIIFLVGTLTTQQFLGKDKKISLTQGQIFEYPCQENIFHFIPLYHPDFISLNSSIKNLTWNSVKNLMPWIKQHLS